jgi:hypothetical protein
MAEKGYFVEGEARATGEETMPEPQEDQVVVYEDFFIAGLRMPPHHTLADIMLKCQAQLQLTPNAIAQLSKYFWTISSFGGVPSGEAIVKRYQLNHHPKRMEIDRGVVFVQFGCLNFHAK